MRNRSEESQLAELIPSYDKQLNTLGECHSFVTPRVGESRNYTKRYFTYCSRGFIGSKGLMNLI